MQRIRPLPSDSDRDTEARGALSECDCGTLVRGQRHTLGPVLGKVALLHGLDLLVS